jgi:hypothetical protein
MLNEIYIEALLVDEELRFNINHSGAGTAHITILECKRPGHDFATKIASGPFYYFLLCLLT